MGRSPVEIRAEANPGTAGTRGTVVADDEAPGDPGGWGVGGKRKQVPISILEERLPRPLSQFPGGSVWRSTRTTFSPMICSTSLGVNPSSRSASVSSGRPVASNGTDTVPS